MENDTIITVFLLVFFFVIAFTFLRWYKKQRRKQWLDEIKETVESERREIERRAKAVAGCLLELGLLQFEEETKRLEMARKLCLAILKG